MTDTCCFLLVDFCHDSAGIWNAHRFGISLCKSWTSSLNLFVAVNRSSPNPQQQAQLMQEVQQGNWGVQDIAQTFQTQEQTDWSSMEPSRKVEQNLGGGSPHLGFWDQSLSFLVRRV